MAYIKTTPSADTLLQRRTKVAGRPDLGQSIFDPGKLLMPASWPRKPGIVFPTEYVSYYEEMATIRKQQIEDLANSYKHHIQSVQNDKIKYCVDCRKAMLNQGDTFIKPNESRHSSESSSVRSTLPVSEYSVIRDVISDAGYDAGSEGFSDESYSDAYLFIHEADTEIVLNCEERSYFFADKSGWFRPVVEESLFWKEN